MSKYSFEYKSRFNLVERNDIVRIGEECLWAESGEMGRRYLLSERKLSETVIKQFRLGYIPDDVNHQLHGRIIIPLYDPSNNLVIVGSRLARKETEEDFLRSYWHERYEKSFYLFGVNLAKEWMRKWGFAVVVEGQFDCIQMHNHGIRNTVALCSTHLSYMQFATILRYCEDILLMLDNDDNKSGEKGTEKILDEMYQIADIGPLDGNAEHTVSQYLPRSRIIPVPFTGAKDPDELLKSGKASLLKALIKQKVRELRESHVYN